MNRCVLLSVALALGIGLALAVVVGLGALSVRAAPGVLFVKPGGTGTACTQANPCDLQTALAQAGDGDTLYLAQGVYRGTGGAVITITKSITLYGGWDGAASGPVVRDPATYPTTLDGEGVRRVVGMRGPALITVTLDGLTLTNGFAADQGGGFYARDVALTLRNTTVYSNVANSRGTSNTQGGGGYILGGSLAVLSSTFAFNSACCDGCGRTVGGGVWDKTDSTTVDNSLFQANDAREAGGFMFDGPPSPAPVVIRATTFRDNGFGLSPCGNVSTFAGGATLSKALAVVERCDFVHNKASNEGGGFWFSDGRLTFSRNRVRDNVAPNAAGLSIWNASAFTLTNNVVSDNARGSAVSTVELVRSAGWLLHNTVARNGAAVGGIHLKNGSSAHLVNTILVGHAVGIQVSAGCTATLEATLWGSGAWANGKDWDGSGAITTGTVNIRGDPCFLSDGYHLGAGSAAIDAGVGAGVATDVDGDRRPIGAGYDIGADERRHVRHLPAVMRNRRY